MLIGRLPFKSDLLRELNKIAEQRGIKAGSLQVMGSLRRAHLSFYDQKMRAYRVMDFDEAHEIVSGCGDISLREDKPYVHLHISVANSEGKVVGGHCLEGCSVYAVEFSIIPFNGEPPRRVIDQDTGLLLWENAIYEG